jgi:formylglycine-generating enzyme required for sulfatase activity
METDFQNLVTRIITEEGIGVFDKPAVCRKLLHQYAEQRYKREIRLLLMSLEAGCHWELLTNRDLDNANRGLILKLQDEYGIASPLAEETITFLGTIIEKWNQIGKEKISHLEKKAQKGDCRSQYELGLLYEKLKNYEGAIRWLKEAAEQGLALQEQSVRGGVGAYSKAGGVKGDNPVANTFILIKGGTFMMGSPLSELERHDNERQHYVKISPFSIGACEVTQQEYQQVMGINPSSFKGAFLPVEKISWYDGIEYCNKRSLQEGLTPVYILNKGRIDTNNNNDFDTLKWLVTWNENATGYRLPTEAEWEYACRAGTTTAYHTGNSITLEQANYDSQSGTLQHSIVKVGSFPPNPWGLYDMHGNLFEWCWDWHGVYSGTNQADPPGAGSGTHRVLRGGSWHKPAVSMRSAYRVGSTPSLRSSEFGLRIVRNS